MASVEQMQRGIDFIEDHLEEDIVLARVAQAASMSQWHFQRVFKALTGDTVKTYIRSRRMSLALKRLAETDMRIIEIAVAAGFESQEAFTRAFRQAFALTPAQYRKVGKRNQFPKKVQLTPEYLESLRFHVSRDPAIERFERLFLAGLATAYYGEGSEKNNIAERIPALWGEFLPRWEQARPSLGNIGYGVIEQTLDEDRLTYTAAAPLVGSAGPAGMTLMDIPAAEYAVFEHRGAVARLDHTVSYAYSTWLLSSGRRHSGGPDLEIYGAKYHPTSDQSVIQYAMPLQD